jgi:hypothetical protein
MAAKINPSRPIAPPDRLAGGRRLAAAAPFLAGIRCKSNIPLPDYFRIFRPKTP